MENKDDELRKLQTEKEEKDKLLLRVEIALATISIVAFLALFLGSLYIIETLKIYLLPIIIIILAFVLLFGGGTVCMLIEQKAGYYKCGRCEHKYVPTFNQSMWAPHILRTKYMKCPHCKKRSWNKKVIK